MQKWGKNPLLNFGLWTNNPRNFLNNFFIKLKNWRIFSQKIRKIRKKLHLKNNFHKFPHFFSKIKILKKSSTQTNVRDFFKKMISLCLQTWVFF
jgi:hypothetical protein